MQDDSIINEKDLKSGKTLVFAALTMIFIIMCFITFLIYIEQQKKKDKQNIEQTTQPPQEMF